MIIIACDHAGFKLKQKMVKYFIKKSIDYKDLGPSEYNGSDSYVEYAIRAIEYFISNCDMSSDRLLLICGSGVGMSIVANRNKKIRAVLCYSKKQAKQARMHNDANCLCLGGRNTSFMHAKLILATFLRTSFLGGKYEDRLRTFQ